MDKDELEEKRLRARLALEGEERTVQRKKSEAEIAKMRQEAMLAMEGNERKARRENQIKEEEAQKEAEKKRLAEIEQLKKLEEDRKKAELEKVEAELAKQEKAKETKLEKIHQSEAEIEDLKKAPVAITSVRTLKSDMAQAVERKKISESSIALKNQNAPKNISFSEKNKKPLTKTIISIVVVALLIGAGITAIWYVQKSISGRTVSVGNANTPNLITAEFTEIINLASSTPASQNKEAVKSALNTTANGTTNFYFTTTTANPEDPEKTISVFVNPAQFTALTNIAIPNGLTRLVDDTFTFGTLNNGVKNNFAVFQIKIESADLALARMFEWEETIYDNFSEVWDIAPSSTTTAASTTTVATTTQTTLQIEGSFKDVKVNNLDTRVLYDSNQNPVLLYTFFNNKYVIITTDTSTVTDIITRLGS